MYCILKENEKELCSNKTSLHSVICMLMLLKVKYQNHYQFRPQKSILFSIISTPTGQGRNCISSVNMKLWVCFAGLMLLLQAPYCYYVNHH